MTSRKEFNIHNYQGEITLFCYIYNLFDIQVWHWCFTVMNFVKCKCWKLQGLRQIFDLTHQAMEQEPPRPHVNALPQGYCSQYRKVTQFRFINVNLESLGPSIKPYQNKTCTKIQMLFIISQHGRWLTAACLHFYQLVPVEILT